MLNQLIKQYLIKRRNCVLFEILYYIDKKEYYDIWVQLYDKGIYYYNSNNKDKFFKYLCDKNKYYLNLILCSFDGYILQFMEEQSPELCIKAVRQNGYIIQFVKEQTPEICLAAVKQDGLILRYIKKQTPEICLVAVKRNGLALQFVKIQTPEICEEAVRQNEKAIIYINKNIIIELLDYYTKTKI